MNKPHINFINSLIFIINYNTGMLKGSFLWILAVEWTP